MEDSFRISKLMIRILIFYNFKAIKYFKTKNLKTNFFNFILNGVFKDIHIKEKSVLACSNGFLTKFLAQFII